MKNYCPALRQRLTLFTWVIILTLCICLLSSCSSLRVQDEVQDNETYYANDMFLTINGVVCRGVCKAPAAAPGSPYNIRIIAEDSIDQVVVSTCARTELPVPETLGNKKKGYTFVYKQGVLEKDAGCNLSIAGYIKDKGKATSALVVFDNEKFKVKAGVSCNGIPDYWSVGTGICQAMTGQRMLLAFDQEMKISERKLKKSVDVVGDTAEDLRCQIERSSDGKVWRISLPKRECNFLFETAKSPYQQYLLHTVGAEKIQIRGN